MSNLYHVPNRYTRGSIQLNKGSIGDIMELISLHPTAAEVGVKLTRQQAHFIALGQYLDLYKIDNRIRVYEKKH